MRFTIAAFVASLAVGPVVAGPTQHLRHMQMHAAREAEPVPAPTADAQEGIPTDPAWYAKNVDWSKVNWASVFGGSSSASATAAPAAAATTTVVSAPSAPSSQAASSSAAAPSSSSSGSSSGSDALGSLISDATGDLTSIISALSSNAAGLSIKQATSSVSSSGPYSMQVSNSKSSDMLLVCWDTNTGYQSSFVGKGVNAPMLTVPIPAGKSQMIYFQNGESGACSPVWSDTAATEDGQIQQTLLEYTFSPTGVVDISREVYMEGDSIATTVGSTGCKSNMDQCVFTCTSGTSCMDNYQLSNCAGQNGAVPGARDGGCGWNGATTDKITAIFG